MAPEKILYDINYSVLYILRYRKHIVKYQSLSPAKKRLKLGLFTFSFINKIQTSSIL